jgi:hypothetical protein
MSTTKERSQRRASHKSIDKDEDGPPPRDEADLAAYYEKKKADRLLSNQRAYERQLLSDSLNSTFAAIQRCDFWALKFLIESDDSLLQARSKECNNATLLMFACATSQCNVEFIELLIGLTSDSCSINEIDASNCTALHYFIRNITQRCQFTATAAILPPEAMSILTLLLHCGANPSAVELRLLNRSMRLYCTIVP